MATTTEYRRALDELQAATNAMDQIAENASSLLRLLPMWRLARLSGTVISVDPARVGQENECIVDLRSWPAADVLIDAMTRVHAARSAARTVYQGLSDDDRALISPP